ncbi:MAG: class B sortase [Clostridiales bacterium]|nr:class B sortase [Clostridiales bacterium]
MSENNMNEQERRIEREERPIPEWARVDENEGRRPKKQKPGKKEGSSNGGSGSGKKPIGAQTVLRALGVVVIIACCAFITIKVSKGDAGKPSGGTDTPDIPPVQVQRAKNPVLGNSLTALAAKTGSNTNYPAGIQERFKYLYSINPDLIGWIKIANSSIDMPIYQTSNNSYYLDKDIYRKYYLYGVCFMDRRNSAVNFSRNTILYAHNGHDEYLFAELLHYREIDYYKAHPVIEMSTLYKDYKYKVIACFVTSWKPEDDNGYRFNYIYPDMSNANFTSYINQLRDHSIIDTNVDVNENDKILTLSTCTREMDTPSYHVSDARFVVVARLVRDGESADVDVGGAQLNTSVRYPQLWFDVNGKTNPFKGASRWYPEA